ncbi:MAG: hypothetical protein HYZ11_07210 [Candidatus Tectomicrobia bacterium]|uniref:PilZ domain-containing protein n=1 Tax=Tectimicrobiota bacterium TaxID=2528274 RepID=A0A932MPQ5_UNCTE|nr:hypothetical protein [Candidatus Tectomicrobia bacterium]
MDRPEKRRHARTRGSVWIECPLLSGASFQARDISAGGFRAMLAHKPLERHPYHVTLRVGEAAFGPWPAFLAWRQEHAQRPGMWSFGMLVMMQDEQREHLAALLDGVTEAA